MTIGTPSRLHLSHCESGAVFLEFLVAFLPIWTFALCTFQLALIARANLMVKHSADAAARSASVVLPDDPAEYGGEPQMSVDRKRISIGDLLGAMERILSSASSPSARTFADDLTARVLGNVGRSRLNTIRLAAHVPLMSLAPFSVGPDRRSSLRKAIGGAGSLATSLYYQPLAVAVTFPQETGTIVAGPEVTVRVSYAYRCTVPLAGRLLCDAFDRLPSGSDWEQSFFTFAQRLLGGRFREIQHESTALVHSAPYQYRPRSS